MNNTSYVYISAEKLAALIEADCPPVTSVMIENVCNKYSSDCKECWKSWLKDGE